MRFFALLLAAFSLVSSSFAQTHAENHGKYGVWYFNSKHVKDKDDDGDQAIPVLEHPESQPTAPSWSLSQWLRSYLFAKPQPAIVFGSYTSTQVNVGTAGQNILGDAANEPSLAVNPINGNHIVVGWRQFDSVTSNFRQAGNAYSTDGGKTWHNRPVLTPGTFRSDPVLDVDANGNFFYLTLLETFFTDMFGSDTVGALYNYLGPAYGGDKQWMVVDRSNGLGRGNMYEWWSTAGNNYGGRQFSRSTDGGRTWLNPINIPGSPIWGVLDVGSNGDLYLCGLGNSAFTFCRSSNAKDPAQTPVFDLETNVNLGGGIVFGSSVNPAGLMGQTWLATDKSNGPNRGNIYVLCSVGVDNNNPCDVHFVRSTDGGKTWSSPKRLNDDPQNAGASHWFGTLAVAPNGRLDACWYDNRANPSSNNSALFFTSSYDGGLTWHKNVQLGPSFNPNIGYPQQNKMGDYLGLVSDASGADIAYASTYNHEEDIWFARVPALTSQTVNASDISPYEGTYASGDVSSVWQADNFNYCLNSVYVQSLGHVAEAQADYFLPINNPSTLSIRARVSTKQFSAGMLYLFNWKSGKYDYQQPFPITANGFADATLTITVPLANYVDANNRVRLILRALAPARLSTQFQLQIDLLQLMFG
jgi:hypothetical protein